LRKKSERDVKKSGNKENVLQLCASESNLTLLATIIKQARDTEEHEI